MKNIEFVNAGTVAVDDGILHLEGIEITCGGDGIFNAFKVHQLLPDGKRASPDAIIVMHEGESPEWLAELFFERTIAAKKLGSLGGASKSRSKKRASRANGKLGGRPVKK